ncbi:MAG: SRPBCC family protein [Halobacteriota archaeon]
MPELTTTIDIDAPPERVWAVLVDFDDYPEWNPFMRVMGRPNLGADLVVELRPPGMRRSRFRPRVTSVDRGHELRWLGHLGVAGLFDGDHRFVVDERPDGGTRFTQSETFGGVLSGPVFRWLATATERGFREMNEALKQRAESMQTDVSDDVERAV